VGKKKEKELKSNAAGDRPRGVVCERGSPVIKGDAKMYGISMRDSGRRVERGWQGSVSDGKRHRVGASETNRESRTRRGIKRHTKTERIYPKPDRPESNKAQTRARAEEAMSGSTCITLVEVARSCGVRQRTRQCVDVGSGLR